MNRPDFDEFAALWQEEPNREEQAQMEALARKARRRGRLLGLADYGHWFGIVLLFVGGMFVTPTPTAIGLAVPLIILMTWVTWKRRGLRQMSLTLNTADRRTFIKNSIRNVKANLRRGVISLLMLAFAVPFSIIFKVAVRTGGGPREVLEAFGAWFYTIRALIMLTILIVLTTYVLYQRRKLKAELQRLQRLESRYELEDDQDRAGEDGR